MKFDSIFGLFFGDYGFDDYREFINFDFHQDILEI